MQATDSKQADRQQVASMQQADARLNLQHRALSALESRRPAPAQASLEVVMSRSRSPARNLADAFNSGKGKGVDLGFQKGKAYHWGYASGLEDGMDKGYRRGFTKGKAKGHTHWAT